jgi:hypothetical protein
MVGIALTQKFPRGKHDERCKGFSSRTIAEDEIKPLILDHLDVV